MTRKDLEEIINGEDETNEKITQILNRHHAEIKQLTDQSVEAEKEKAETLSQQLKDTKKALAEMRKKVEENSDAEKVLDESNKRIEELEKALNDSRINGAIEIEILNSKVRNKKTAELIRKSLDLSRIAVEKDGSVKGIQEQLDELKKDDDTSFLFLQTEKETPLQKYKPAAGSEVAKKSYGKEFAEAEVKNINSFNETFESAIIG